MHTAIIFPGQGSQRIGMLYDYYNKFKEFKETFIEANDILNFNLWKVIQEDNIKLNNTEYTQPILLASSIAIWRIIKKYTNINFKFFAGHSLGEYSALCAADSINFSDALLIVKLRGKLMQSAVKDKKCAMSAIISLNHKQVTECCKLAQSFGIVEPANFNSHEQIVISGEISAIQKANNFAKDMGAKYTKILPVSIPSHSSLMKDMSNNFSICLDKLTIALPKIPVIHNYDVVSHKNINDIKKSLVKQLYSPVRWIQTIEKFIHFGIKNIIECGPGKVLTSLNKRINKSIYSQETSNIKSIDLILNQTNNF